MKRSLIFFGIILVIVLVGFRVSSNKNVTQSSYDSKTSSSSNGAIKYGNAQFNKNLYSLTDPNSLWVIVNKKHPLEPKNFIPKDLVVPSVPLRVPGNETMKLRRDTALALEHMFSAAESQSIKLMLSSGYRSYTYQLNLYSGYIASIGQSAADQQSARPGYSEHQTGLAADLEPINRSCEVQQCFANTPEGKWLAANAYRFGFIIRYQLDTVNITGYEYEPWHIRYVGIDLAAQMRNQNIDTLEQFFNVSGGTSYQS